jgi:hypothetical protein
VLMNVLLLWIQNINYFDVPIIKQAFFCYSVLRVDNFLHGSMFIAGLLSSCHPFKLHREA